MAKKKESVRWDWHHNQALLRDAYLKLLAEHGRPPKLKELAEESGLAPRTVDRHIKELRFKPLDSPARLLTPDIINAVASSALEGNDRAQKLWFQLMEGVNFNGEADTGKEDTPSTQVHIYLPDNGRSDHGSSEGAPDA